MKSQAELFRWKYCAWVKLKSAKKFQERKDSLEQGNSWVWKTLPATSDKSKGVYMVCKKAADSYSHNGSEEVDLHLDFDKLIV